MNASDEWARWGEAWREQSPVDAAGLSRQVRRKRWRMLAFASLEWLVSIVSFIQTLRLMRLPQAGWRMQLWSICALVLICTLQGLFLHVRRGTWRASAERYQDLLQLSVRRALAGIRLAQLHIGSTVLLIVITLLLAVPALWGHWQDGHLWRMVWWNAAVNGVIVLLTFVLCAWYIRRQRRRLVRLRALLEAAGRD